MPPRTKRNAPSRRHPRSTQPDFTQPEPGDLLSFDQDSTQPPSVFQLDPPLSDPDLGRQSSSIRSAIDHDNTPHKPVHYAYDVYGPPTSGSDLDDGPISVSNSPPHQSSLRAYSITRDPEPSPDSTGSVLRKFARAEDTTSDESSLSRSVGHTRSPVLVRPRSQHLLDREPTTLESFSRTIRNYVPSSIPIPTAAPSPPRVSRPVSFGSFLTPSTASTTHQRTHTGDERDDWKRRGSHASAVEPPGARRLSAHQQHRGGDRDMPVFSLDDDIPEDSLRDDDRQITRYPGIGDTEEVVWAGWDVLTEGEHAQPRSILMLGYPTGLQIWDCSNLGSVTELLNLTGPQWGVVDFAGMLPEPPQAVVDEFRHRRPLVAFSSRTVHGTDVLVYSLRSHEVVKRLPLIGFTSFAASPQFIILSTSNPPTIHVISSCTLATLYTISSASLIPFAYPVSSYSTAKPNDVLSSLDIETLQALSASPRPIYALSNRLLAYVSPLSSPASSPPVSSSSGRGYAHTSTPVPPPENPGQFKLGLGMSQADLGTAAVKIGGSVLSGMKALGGMAISAARAGVSAAAGEPITSPRGSGLGSMFFSKSAPAATGSPHEYQTTQDRRRRSLRMSPPANVDIPFTTTGIPGSLPPTSPVKSQTGCQIMVVDLRPLLSTMPADAQREPELVARFKFPKPYSLSGLSFSADGTMLALSSRDGHAVRVLQLRTAPRLVRALSSRDATLSGTHEPHTLTASSSQPPAHLEDSAQLVYTLRRGRTSAVVDNMAWAHDKLWFGMSTQKGTVHVFAMNALGGNPDGASHIAGKVVNSRDLISTATDLSALVRLRLRLRAVVGTDIVKAAPAFTFVHPSSVTLPSTLLPAAAMNFSTSSSPSSVSPTGGAGGLPKPVSPAQRPTHPTNYKDLLVFDPADGTLTLRRVFVEQPSAEPQHNSYTHSTVPAPGGMSISLPGMSTLGRSVGAAVSSSPPARAMSGLTQMMTERSADIVGRESIVGTWNLVRARDWPEVKQSVKLVKVGGERRSKVARSDWLARAELSTFSTSPRILPRLVYLSHQFRFHILGENYNTLVRDGRLGDVPSAKIEVRRPVEVSAFSTAHSNHTDMFVHELGSPHDFSSSGSGSLGRDAISSSFDAPLASALSAPLAPLHPSPPVLPMLPNGTPGSASASKAFIPIRHVAAGIHDGMSEGLVRIRRELGKTRSPHPISGPSVPGDVLAGSVPSVPLEFDEEDEMEDFHRHAVHDDLDSIDNISRSTSKGTNTASADGVSALSALSTPATNIEPLPVEHDGEQAWQGWGPEDKQAVEDAERFDDITVGFLDEEQHSVSMMRAIASEESEGRSRRGKKRRTGQQ
ncbi:hypothetical protein BC628DRAFT_1412942 [Trametes gibbosa]|nr:hypothetical protein BC628DRAFT_1412942 [Trametes gibbosa]